MSQKKYIIRVDRPSMLNGVADCAERYDELPNSETYGYDSFAIFKVNDGRPYTIQFARYKSGTIRVFAYEESKEETE